MPLHEAANHNRVEIAKLLINFGSDVNDRGGEKCRGITPLMDACSTGGCEMIQLLLDNGADTIAKDDSNKYPLDALLDYRASVNDRLTPDQRREIDEIEEMLSCAMIKKGITPKITSFQKLQTDNEGASVNMEDVNPATKSSLFDSDEEDSLEPSAPTRPPVALSPTETATEMYRNSIANVRKSGKQAAAGPQTTTQASKTDKDGTQQAALLPADCDADLPATGDWLVNDTEASPVKKRQRVTDPIINTSNTRKPRAAKKATKKPNSENINITVPETPERVSELHSRSPSPMDHEPEATNSRDKSIDLTSERSDSPPLSSRSSVYDDEVIVADKSKSNPSAAVVRDNSAIMHLLMDKDDNSSTKRSREPSPALSSKSSVYETGGDNPSPAKKKTKSSREPSPEVSSQKSPVYGGGSDTAGRGSSNDRAGHCGSFSPSPIRQEGKSKRKSRSRIRLPSMSPEKPDMDIFTEASQPLTPAFNEAAKSVDSDITPTNSPQKENIPPNANKATKTELSLFKTVTDALVEPLRTRKENVKPESQSSGQQADTQSVSASQPSPADGKHRESSPSVELQRVQVSTGGDNQSDVEPEPGANSSPSSVHSGLSIEWTQANKTRIKKERGSSPKIAKINNERGAVSDASSNGKRNDDILDEIMGETSTKTKQTNNNKEKKEKRTQINPPISSLPTSTPLRKSLNLMMPMQGSSPSNNLITAHRPHSPANSEAKDSGFPQDSSFIAPSIPYSSSATVPGNPFNSSMSSIRGGVRDTINSSVLDNSYYNNIRILVQWKSRTLLIPIPRCESPSISWLCDELVRRLSRRRPTFSQASSNGSAGVPDSQQIILTRASDGAELFPEDTITDLLNDNEKVIAVEIEDA